MKKNSIKAKIRRTFLQVCIISLGVSSILSLFMLLNIRNVTMMGNNAIGSAAADNSAASLLDQALLDMASIVQVKGDVIDRDIRKAVDSVELMKGYIESVYRNKGEFRLIRIPNYKNVPENQLRMHWFLEGGMLANHQFNENDLNRTGLMEETYLLGNLERMAQLIMENNPDIFTIYLSTESGQNIQFDTDAALKASYPVQTLHDRAWYTIPRDTKSLYISDAYRDTAGRGLTLSITLPYYSSSNEFMGVVGIDIKIEDLDKSIRETVVGETGYALLLNNSEAGGTSKIISAPGLTEDNENDLAAYLGNNMGDLLSNMKASSSGVGQSVLKQDGNEYGIYVIWAPVSLTNWQLAYVAPVDDIIAPATIARDEIIRMSNVTSSQVDNRVLVTILILSALLIAIILIVSYVASLMAGRIVRPIITLTGDVQKIGQGNLDYHSEIQTGDEVEELSQTFEHMTKELVSYIDNLGRVTAEKERIGAELDVATKIQASMLPSIFPAFPDAKEFDIYASMLPAKEVGGDFYDFFFINKDTLAVLIADVSGKGVPAALFMVIAKTLIKSNAQYNNSPKEVFELVNNMLCETNDENLFVTAFMGYLDIPTGKFTYVNAGHNHPLIKHGDNFQWLKAPPGFVLAGMQDMVYEQQETFLDKDDVLFLYTDGVTEAANNEQKLFSDARLLECANKYRNSDLKPFVVSIKGEIDQFANGAEQADDITVLVLQYKGIVTMKELKIEAKLENLDAVLAFVDAELEAQNCPMKVLNQVNIAVEEIFVNIAHYAYDSLTGEAGIRVVLNGKELVIEFEDMGKPFNPLELADPDTISSVDERDIGGLGVFMTKKFMDNVEYQHKDNKNILVLKKLIK